MTLGDLLRINPGEPVNLAAIDTRGTPGLPERKSVRKDPKAWAARQLIDVRQRLATHQEQLYATAKVGAGRARVLLVLQAMDCGGKDGTIKRVAGSMNPQGLSITAFGKPTEEELAHDFLWRIRRALPEPGYVGMFNRSHYEDVLVVRVRELVPRTVWGRRYNQINRFEHQLVADGIRLVKVMLHISFREQSERLAQRLADPTKYWKFNPSDIDERERWSDYQAAYAEAFHRCSTPAAPWYVVPADQKRYRDWAVSSLLAESLESLDLHYPPADFDIEEQRRRLSESDKAGPGPAVPAFGPAA